MSTELGEDTRAAFPHHGEAVDSRTPALPADPDAFFAKFGTDQITARVQFKLLIPLIAEARASVLAGWRDALPRGVMSKKTFDAHMNDAVADALGVDRPEVARSGGKAQRKGDPSKPGTVEAGKPKREKSQAQELVALAHEMFELGITTEGRPFVVPRRGPRVAQWMRGGSFVGKLAVGLHQRTGMVCSSNARGDALHLLTAQAESADRVELTQRVARHGEDLVLDLGDDTGRVVVITPGGWMIEDRSPVLFARSLQTLALPTPVRGGSLDALWSTVNVAPASRELYIADVLSYLFPHMDHPILDLSGEAGAGKTTTARNTARLIDPSAAPLARMPRDEKDLDIVASQSYVLAFDNISRIEDWQSDALCAFCTGISAVRRELYTDSGLALLKVRLCAILTSIDYGTPKADLGQRLLPIRLSPLPEGDRRDEEQIDLAFAAAHPGVLGVLLDLAAAVLAEMPAVDEAVERGSVRLPRLAGFGKVCAALDQACSSDRLATYREVLDEQAVDVATEDEVATAIRQFTREHDGWQGTPTELHTALTQGKFRSRFWPETAATFGKRVSLVIGSLRKVGIDVQKTRPGRGRDRHAEYVLSVIPNPPTDDGPRGEPDPGPADDGPAPSGGAESSTPAALAEVTPDTPAPDAEPSSTDLGTGLDAETPCETAEAASTGPTPCPVCSTAGPWCGSGTMAEDEEPCIVCAQPTLMRSLCGAPRHAHLDRKPTEWPDTDASTAALPDPHEQAPTTAERTRTAPARRGSVKAEPRRGLHLYGVLDGEALTIVSDRRAGPPEPLGEDYPANAAGCVALARRLHLEAMWVHESALSRLDVTGVAESGWEVHGRGDPDAVELAVPARADNTWADAGTGRELAAGLAAYESALSIRFRVSPAATGLSLLGMLHKRKGAVPLVTPETLPPAEVCDTERALSWCRVLTDTERGHRYVHGLDKHGAYLGAASDLIVGLGDAEHVTDHVGFNSKVPGVWRVSAFGPAPGRDARLPHVGIGDPASSMWRSTATLAYAAEQGAEVTVREAWVWPSKGKPLSPFYRRCREGRMRLTGRAAAGEPGCALALSVLKETYSATLGGALASRATGERDTPGSLYRPDWRSALVARARVNLLRNVDKHGVHPFAADVDQFFFTSDSPDPASVGLPMGDGLGEYGAKTAAELDDAIRTAAEGGRLRPLLTALGVRGE